MYYPRLDITLNIDTEKKGNTGVRVHIVEKEYVGESIKGAVFAKGCETSQKKQSMDQEITIVDVSNDFDT